MACVFSSIARAEPNPLIISIHACECWGASFDVAHPLRGTACAVGEILVSNRL
jgi:hypothetical protein